MVEHREARIPHPPTLGQKALADFPNRSLIFDQSSLSGSVGAAAAQLYFLCAGPYPSQTQLIRLDEIWSPISNAILVGPVAAVTVRPVASFRGHCAVTNSRHSPPAA